MSQIEQFEEAWNQYKEDYKTKAYDKEKTKTLFKLLWDLDLATRQKKYEEIKKFYSTHYTHSREKSLKSSINFHIEEKKDKKTPNIEDLPRTIKAAVKRADKDLLKKEIEFERKVLGKGPGPIEWEINKWIEKREGTRFDRFWRKNVDGPLTRRFGKKKSKQLKF